MFVVLALTLKASCPPAERKQSAEALFLRTTFGRRQGAVICPALTARVAPGLIDVTIESKLLTQFVRYGPALWHESEL
jgi:hypothetical protein